MLVSLRQTQTAHARAKERAELLPPPVPRATYQLRHPALLRCEKERRIDRDAPLLVPCGRDPGLANHGVADVRHRYPALRPVQQSRP